MSRRLEDYAMIGDGETAALVGRDGSIDWLCWPRFDADACFAALLGTVEHGRWIIAPATPVTDVSRGYLEDTLILETVFKTATGAIKLIDFMPIRDGSPCLIREITGIGGEVSVRLDINLRFDYGSIPPWSEATETGFVARVGPDLVVLHAPIALSIERDAASAAFKVGAGQCLTFCLRHAASTDDVPPAIEPKAAQRATAHYWREWIGRFHGRTAWPTAVRRSLITLKALIHQPSGGLIAAPTTSLPERPGGTMNWDYRFCWLRDATFTLSALLNAGYHEEALAWRDWMMRAVAGTPARMRIMYRIDGGRHLNEWTVDWLPGFNHTAPVRVGNAAAAQHQIDVIGELLDSLALCARAGLPSTSHTAEMQRALVRHLEATWQSTGHGIWEARSEARHYTYSKAMAWAGLDRFIRGPGAESCDPTERARLAALRDRIHGEICSEGFHPGLGSFVQHYGGQELDASLLLLPLIGFLPIDDPRIDGTIAAVERHLMADGLVIRHRIGDGGSPEGAFIACTCWLADCLSLQGRHAAARAAFERVLSLANDVGLLAEEYNLRGRHLAGNFPQALSHLAVVNTGLGLCGPVLQRAAT
jgi:GH15 family glucan-1,4-alpha-glucosidase